MSRCKVSPFVQSILDMIDEKTKQLPPEEVWNIELLADDIIQYILLFAGLYHTKAVSKKWKEYSEQNERKHLTKLYSSINDIKSPVQYDENINKTYIIHPNRKKLHEMEIGFGYVGPMQDINKTLRVCNSGDRLLVHDGVYNPICNNEGYERMRLGGNSIQLIGVGANVSIRSGLDSVGSPDGTVKIWDIRNIKFDSRAIGLTVEINGTLYLENCELKCGVWAGDGAHLHVNNCRIVTRIELSMLAKAVNIIDCIFEGWEIVIYSDVPLNTYDDYVPVGIVQLKCVGNIFDFSNPLARRHVTHFTHWFPDVHPIFEQYGRCARVATPDRYTLTDNLLKVQDKYIPLIYGRRFPIHWNVFDLLRIPYI